MCSESEKRLGLLIVVSGPSGVGKSTVIKQLLSGQKNLYFSVSFTTRDPRPGEENGANYHFVSKQEFERMIAEDEMLEYAEYVGNYYGTSRRVTEDHLRKGMDVLLDIEIQGATKVKEKYSDTIMIFLAPPTIKELEHRLRARNTNTEEEVARRLDRAQIEFKEIVNYDYLVVNDTVQNAVEKISSILQAEKCRVRNESKLITDLGCSEFQRLQGEKRT